MLYVYNQHFLKLFIDIYSNKYASYPDWHISHMPIADRHEIQIVYNTGRHRASGSQFLTPHTVRRCPAILSHQANDRPMDYRFFTFWPRGLNLGPQFTKGGDDLLPT